MGNENSGLDVNSLAAGPKRQAQSRARRLLSVYRDVKDHSEAGTCCKAGC